MLSLELEEIVRLYEAGKVRPHIDEVFPFERANEAFARIEQGKNLGKLVLEP